MKVLLETERLILRAFTRADAQHLFELDNDPEVMRFINGGIATSFEVIEKDRLPGFLSHDVNAPEFGFWAAIHKETHAFAGWFVFRLAQDDPRVAALGYRLRKEVWGKGYATEGAKALLDKGFSDLAVEQFVATTYEKNLASQRVLEKLGMHLVRRFQLSQEELQLSDTSTHSAELWDGDELEYALTKKDWLKNS